MTKSTQKKWFVWAIVLGGVALVFSGDFAIGVAVIAVLLMPILVAMYIPYAKDNPKKLWFKRKLYGWGWTPVTWQGWVTTLAYAVLVVVFALTIDENSSQREVMFTFLLPFVLLTITFIRIAYKYGEKPRWQWGTSQDDEKNEGK